MAEQSKIQWCDATWNPWEGCEPVSPGCANCYASAQSFRFHGHKYRKGCPRTRHSDATFNAPLRWNKQPWVCDRCSSTHTVNGTCPVCGYCWFHRRRVFSLSLGDWLDPEVPIEWLTDMLDVIRRCPELDFLLLTKRPELWVDRMQRAFTVAGGFSHERGCELSLWIDRWMTKAPPVNIWLGFSAENQETFDERSRHALNIPAVVTFCSMEPLLGPVQLGVTQGSECHFYDYGTGRHVDWVIVGGESGPGARPCNVDWIRSTVQQCKAAGVPVFVKQLGSAPYVNPVERGWPVPLLPDNGDLEVIRTKGTDWTPTLQHHKGGDPAEWPEDLRVREFPEVTR